MSADAVLEDALREAGYAHVTAWHLRCVEAYLTQRRAVDMAEWDSFVWQDPIIERRILDELACSEDDYATWCRDPRHERDARQVARTRRMYPRQDNGRAP